MRLVLGARKGVKVNEQSSESGKHLRRPNLVARSGRNTTESQRKGVIPHAEKGHCVKTLK